MILVSARSWTSSTHDSPPLALSLSLPPKRKNRGVVVSSDMNVPALSNTPPVPSPPLCPRPLSPVRPLRLRRRPLGSVPERSLRLPVPCPQRTPLRLGRPPAAEPAVSLTVLPADPAASCVPPAADEAPSFTVLPAVLAAEVTEERPGIEEL